MKSRIHTLTMAVVAGTLAGGIRMHAQAATWTGHAGDGLWTSGANWSTGIPPTSANNVTLNGGSVANPIVAAGPSITANALTIGSTSAASGQLAFTSGQMVTAGIVTIGNFGRGGSLSPAASTCPAATLSLPRRPTAWGSSRSRGAAWS